MSESNLNFVDRDYTFKFEKYFDRGWEIFRQYIWGFSGFLSLNFLISTGLSELPQSEAALPTAIYNFVTPVLTAGYYIVALKLAKNKSRNFADFFAGFKRFFPIFLVNLVSSLLIFLGLILFILPGIYLVIAYLFAILFILEYRFGVWQALEASRKVISKHWLSFFGFSLTLLYVNLVGILFLGIGLLVTIPLSYCAIVAAFEDIVGWKSVNLEK